MGAQQSAAGRGHVKLRRRSATAGAVTSDELEQAGVDIARAVAQNAALAERRQQQLQSIKQSSTGGGSGSASPAPSSSSVGVGAKPAAVPPPAVTPLAAAAQQQQSKKLSAATIELPPWEIVASIGEKEWFALRTWLDAGWRCRKCGHVRDDHHDHPKAVKLLAACGVVPPQLRKAPGTVSSPGSSRGGGGVVEYASTSPDNRPSYLSDSSPSSSLTSSPLHPKAEGKRRVSHDATGSPRFHNASPGYEHSGGVLSRPQQLGGSGGSGVLGPEACPHLSGGGAVDGLKSGSPSYREQQPGGSSAGSGALDAVGGGRFDGLRQKILQAITRSHQVYFIDKEPNGTLVFDFLLSALLDCTNSSYGFISSALLKADGTPYLKTHAMSNVAWTKELRAWYAANAHKGLVFTNMNTLHGSVVLTGQPVITNDPSSDPRARGVPPGHPPLDSFMGIPLYTGTELIGIYGLANRPEGYDEELQKELEPLTMTVAQMIYAVNERKRRKEAELHLSSVVQVAKEGILSLSHSGHITSMNFSARVVFGFAQEDSRRRGMGGEEVAPPPNLQFQDVVIEIDGREDYLQQGLEHHSGNVHIGKGRRADGSVFPLEVSISKGTYDTVFYVAVVRDMSDQIAAANKLQESEERWQYQVSGIEDGVWDWNLEQNTFFVSNRWFQNLGYVVGELPGSLEVWGSLMHPDDKEAAYAALKDHLDGLNDAYLSEHRLKCKDGTYKWFVHRGRVVNRTAEGEPVHFVGTHADITDRKKYEDANVMVKEATHHLLRLEAEYLARAGLDVHEPAVQIVDSAKQLEATELTEAQKGHVGTISTCGQRLISVVRDQLDCGDIEKGQLELDYHIFAVSETVETAVLIMADRAAVKGLETVIETAPDTPLFIVSDANHCMEVIINLLSAAIVETPKGYVRVRLTAEMVFPNSDDDGDDDDDDIGLAAGGMSRIMPPEALHGPQLHLVLTVDGTSSSEGAKAAETTIAIQTSKKLLPLLGGSLSTMIDPKRGAVYTARIPVNSWHPEYKGAMAMRAAKPLALREPLLQTRVLVVGPTQVTAAAIGKQLNAWQVPHMIVSTTPENAFLTLLPDKKLPAVTLTCGTPPPTTWPDGSARSGLATDYDVVMVDLSHKKTIKGDMQLAQVASVLGRDHVGVILLTRAQWRENARGGSAAGNREGPDMEALLLFACSQGGYWSKRRPIVLHKPMVRPRCLMEAMEDAVRSLPGNEGVLVDKRDGDDLLLLHGFLQKAAAKQKKKAAARTALRGGAKYKGRVLFCEHNAINIHVVELIMSTKGGVHMDSAKTLAEAMKFVKEQPYDIVFLDCHLHGMDDPLSVIRKIREIEGQSAEIIATKQKLQKHEQDQLIAAGATECINRPLTVATLEKFFKEHLISVKQ